jgi:hypothetical protein
MSLSGALPFWMEIVEGPNLAGSFRGYFGEHLIALADGSRDCLAHVA